MEKALIIIKPKKAAYTNSFKPKCIRKVKSGVSIYKVAEEAGVDKVSIRDWLRQKEELLNEDINKLL